MIGASVLFSSYASRFGSLNRTYGVLGAVAILLIWLYLTAYSILLGGELNAEAEHQTKADSTTGPPRPMGARGAYAADTLGR
jgi:membrane protein